MNGKMDDCKGGHSVFVAFLPNWTLERAAELRDHIAESLPLGCAVLPEEITSQIITVPDLGGVKIWSGLDLDPGGYIQRGELTVREEGGLTYVEAANDGPQEAVAADAKKSTASKVGEEKRAILARLKAWREVHGPGCLDAVAKKAGHGITPEMLRDLCLGAVKLLIDDWRRINKALDKLEEEERKAAGNG